VYAANDGTAGGAIGVMKGQGINPATKPTTGQDAELGAIQRILTGEQYMTVYKAVTPEARDAAEVAVALAQGKPIPAGLINQHVANGQEERAVDDPHTGLRHQGERREHHRQEPLLNRVADLRGPVRRGVQSSRSALSSDVGRAASIMAPGPHRHEHPRTSATGAHPARHRRATGASAATACC
jgi:hypothetical protein